MKLKQNTVLFQNLKRLIPVILKLLNGMIGLEQTENNGNHKMGRLNNNRACQFQRSKIILNHKISIRPNK